MRAVHTGRHALVAGIAVVALGVMVGCRPNRAGAANRDGAAIDSSTMAHTDTTTHVDADWSDSKILRVAMTANTIDSMAGAFALQSAQSAAVKEFAQTMIRDHGGANKKAKTVMQHAQIADSVHTGSDDPAQQMQQDAIEQQGELRKLAGMEFDKAYVDREIKMHQDVLDHLDDDLIPHAQNAELKSYLETIRPAVAAHLERAKALKDQLSNRTTGSN